MIDSNQISDNEFSITYPMREIIRRANLKLKLHDRNIPMGSDMWGGMMPNLVGRWRKFNNWSKNGVRGVKVFYEPQYFIRNRHTVELMDPLHMFHVAKYAGIKD
jgi:hypothetical protein